jgi:hypothetical protein
MVISSTSAIVFHLYFICKVSGLYLFQQHSSHSTYTGGKKCISIFFTQSQSQIRHFHFFVLKLNLHNSYHLIFASSVIEKTSLIGVKTQVYVAGLLLGVFHIADWSIITTLSKCSKPLILETLHTFLLALFNLLAK